jgi:chromosomal replication initiation ATPase DnaA
MQWQPMTDVAATTSPQRAEAIRARLMGKQPALTTTGIITREVVKYVEVAPPADQNEHVHAYYRHLATDMAYLGKTVKSIVFSAIRRRAAATKVIDPIIHELCKLYGVGYADIIGNRRHLSIVIPRQKMMWVINQTTNYSSIKIGKGFGGKDHTTVLHAVKKINRMLEDDDPLVADLKGWLND